MPHPGQKPAEEPKYVADWMLGGSARGKMLRALSHDSGWGARDISDLSLGRAWAYEFLRALRAIDAIEPMPGTPARYRLRDDGPLGSSLRELVKALERFETTEVDRPPSRRRPRTE